MYLRRQPVVQVPSMEGLTALQLVLDAERRFNEAALVFGHGTDNARDEAVFLVFHALGLDFTASDNELGLIPDDPACDAVERLVAQRISSRRPAAYLTGRMWFAGREFSVDERALVPRSPLAELIDAEFRPWLDPDKIRRVLEIGTGSGCIAIATALQLPRVEVHATDISADALELAEQNLARYPMLAGRVRFLRADLYPESNDTYDLIISNPPYVPRAVVEALPPEYAHEPRIALEAGSDGLDFVRRICAAAPYRLNARGALMLDVGEMSGAVDAAIEDVAFTWVELEFGGAGIGVALKEQFRPAR